MKNKIKFWATVVISYFLGSFNGAPSWVLTVFFGSFCALFFLEQVRADEIIGEDDEGDFGKPLETRDARSDGRGP